MCSWQAQPQHLQLIPTFLSGANPRVDFVILLYHRRRRMSTFCDVKWCWRATRRINYRRTLAGKFTKPADTGNTRPVDLGGAKSGKQSPKVNRKTLSPFSIYSISRGDIYVNLLWRWRRIFFARLVSWCVGIRNGVEGGEAPPSKTTTEDDVIRC